MGVYTTAIPRKFILDSGEVVILTARDVEEKLVRDILFRLWVPDIEAVYKYLEMHKASKQPCPLFTEVKGIV